MRKLFIFLLCWAMFSPFLQAQVPCASKSIEPWQEWISSVGVAQFSVGTAGNFSSGKATYTDYSATSKFILNRGVPYNFVVGTSWSYITYDEYCKVWIDLNNNGVFEEPSEAVASLALAKPNSNANVSAINYLPFSISPSTLPGNYRMRIAMKRGSMPTPCETFQYGEVEDYGITVSTSTANFVDFAATKTPSNYFPSKIARGVLYRADFTVSKTGTGSFPPNTLFSYHLYYSSNNVLDAADLELSGGSASVDFQGDNIYLLEGQFPTSVPVGSGFLICKFDSGNQIAETNEANNLIVSPIQVFANGLPNLVAETAPLNFGSVAAGTAVNGGFHFANEGPGEGVQGVQWQTKFYLSTDLTVSTNDLLLGTEVYTPGFLPVNGDATHANSFAGALTATIPNGTAPGQYYLLAALDATNLVAETNEADNIRIASITVSGVQPTSCVGNLMYDPGLASPPTSNNGQWVGNATWWMTANPSAVSATTDAVDGSTAVKICSQGSIRQNLRGLTVGKTYQLSMSAKNTGSSNAQVSGRFFNSNWQPLGNTVSKTILTTTYATYNLTLVAPANAFYLEIAVTRIDNGTGCVFADAFCLNDFNSGGGPLPNLALGPIAVAPTTVEEGGVFLLTTTVKNTGVVPMPAGTQGFADFMKVGTPNTIAYSAPFTLIEITDGVTESIVLSVQAGLPNLPIGDYTVKIRLNPGALIAESNYLDNISNQVTVEVIASTQPPFYGPCAVSSSFPYETWISTVAMNNVSKVSGKGTLNDFTSTAFSVKVGTPQAINITTSWSYAFNEKAYYRIWIDYDKDGAFEPNEIITSFIVQNDANGVNVSKTVSNTFTAPLSTALGQTKMRIMMRDGDWPVGSCGNIDYGEAEDYTINFVQNLSSSGGRQVDPVNPDDLANWTLFPNPAGESVSLTMPSNQQETSVAIYNQIGMPEKVLTIAPNTSVMQIDLSEVQNGVYFFKFETAGQRTVVRKLVVSRMY
jgi:GEVED domain/Secretion system C-terminal sorting domain/CARDB